MVTYAMLVCQRYRSRCVDFGAGGSKFKSQVSPHILNTHKIEHQWKGGRGVEGGKMSTPSAWVYQ